MTNPKLADALQDAQVLLAFAAQSGIAIDQAVIKNIVATANLVSTKQISEADEVAFWAAFNALAKALCPVSVASLRATMDSHAKPAKILGFTINRGSLARRAVRWYTTITVGTLIFLLLFQVYWIFGSTITADIQKVNKDLPELDSKLQLLERPIAQSSSAAKGFPATVQTDAIQRSAELHALKAQRDSLALHKTSIYGLLGIWSYPWNSIVSQVTVASVDQPDHEISLNIARFQTALIALDVLQRYVLPLLYGLLGTCVYVLRTLTADIKSRTYSEASNIGFRIRLYLGTLSGMVVAWFVTPESAGGLFKSLSPFALAFLAGYSVELLFAAMDRLLEAFSSKPKRELE